MMDTAKLIRINAGRDVEQSDGLKQIAEAEAAGMVLRASGDIMFKGEPMLWFLYVKEKVKVVNISTEWGRNTYPPPSGYGMRAELEALSTEAVNALRQSGWRDVEHPTPEEMRKADEIKTWPLHEFSEPDSYGKVANPVKSLGDLADENAKAHGGRTKEGSYVGFEDDAPAIIAKSVKDLDQPLGGDFKPPAPTVKNS